MSNFELIKIVTTVVLVVAVTEIAKRSTVFAAVIASIPLVSVIAMLWLYLETEDVERVARLSSGIFWMVMPSLLLFITLPILLRQQVDFYLSLAIAISITVCGYLLMLFLLRHFGIEH